MVYDSYPITELDARVRVRWQLLAEGKRERHWRDGDGVVWRARTLFPRDMYRLDSEHGLPRSFGHIRGKNSSV